MAECYNVVEPNDFTGSNLLPPDSYYYQSYYRQAAFNADGLSSVEFASKQDASMFPSPYDDYIAPEVTPYGMLPSLLHSSSGYCDEKRRITECDNSRFHHSFPYVPVSPPGARTDQFPVFPDPYTPSMSSSTDQMIATRPADADLCSADHRSFDCAAPDYQSKIESRVAPDGRKVISGGDSSRGAQIMVDYSPVSNLRTDALQPTTVLPVSTPNNIKTDASSCRTQIPDTKMNVTCKVTPGGQ
jgi:hypothetical protein